MARRRRGKPAPSNTAPKRGFIRCMWGINDDSNRILARKKRTENEMLAAFNNPYNPPCVVYVFGEDNYKYATDMGYECVLIDKDPGPWDLSTQQYRHKLEVFKYAMEVDGYDEILLYDFDCIPKKKLPNDMWEEFGKREVMQANLQSYRRPKCPWRTGADIRKVPNAGFVYIRDKTIPEQIIKCWEEIGSGFSAEPPMALVMDRLTNGWKGIEVYWHLFEPSFCKIHKSSPFAKELIALRDIHFVHYQG